MLFYFDKQQNVSN